MTLSRSQLLHIAKWVLFETTVYFSPDDSEESRDRHWQSRNGGGYTIEKKRILKALTLGLSDIGIEVEERRTRPSTPSEVSSL